MKIENIVSLIVLSYVAGCANPNEVRGGGWQHGPLGESKFEYKYKCDPPAAKVVSPNVVGPVMVQADIWPNSYGWNGWAGSWASGGYTHHGVVHVIPQYVDYHKSAPAPAPAPQPVEARPAPVVVNNYIYPQPAERQARRKHHCQSPPAGFTLKCPAGCTKHQSKHR